jgi:ABC-2 type transport system permease protein
MKRLIAAEAKLSLRDPVVLIWGLLFPVAIMSIIGAIPSFRKPEHDLGGLRVIDEYVPVMIAFVLAMLGCNALPPTLAAYREKGVLRRFATTPVGGWRLLAAQLAVNAVIIVFALLVLLGVGRIAFDVALPQAPLAFVVSVLLAGAALLGIGTFVAAVTPSARVANGVGALLFFPMMFMAGLWIPRDSMPDALRTVSDFTPLGAGVGALQHAAVGEWPRALHLIVLAAYALVFPLLATRLFRWE